MRKTSAFALVLSAILALFSSASSSASAKISVAALKGPTGIGMIHLFESPPSGLNLEISAVASPDLVISRMTTNDVDFAALPINLAAKLHKAGLPYRMVAVIGEGMVSLLASDHSIRSLKDLAGREIYVAGQGATPEFLIRYLLQKEGLDPAKDVKLLFSMPYPEIASSIAAGRIQVAVLPQPFVTLALQKNPALREPVSLGGLWTAATGQKNYPMSVLVAKSSFLDSRPAEAKKVLAAIRDSIEWAVRYPTEAGKLVEKHDMGLSASVAAAAIPLSAYVFTPAAEARASVEKLLGVFLSYDPRSIGGALPEPSFYAEIR